MLRALPRIRRDPLEFLTHAAQTYGDVVEFPIPGQRVFFANHPDAVKQVLQTEHRTHDRATVQYQSLSLVTGNGLLTSDGELWRKERRLMQPAFHRAVLDQFVEHVDIAVDRLLASWARKRDGDVVDVDDAMMRTALEAVGRSLFSHDLSGEAGELVQAVLKALEYDTPGFERYIIASPDSVMTRLNDELVAEVFPGVETRGDLANTNTLLSIEKAKRMLGYSPEHSWRNHV